MGEGDEVGVGEVREWEGKMRERGVGGGER